jgi:hypothetical protein
MGCGASQQQVRQCTSDWYVCMCMCMCTCVYGLWSKPAAAKTVHIGSLTCVQPQYIVVCIYICATVCTYICSTVCTYICATHVRSLTRVQPRYTAVCTYICATHHVLSHVCSTPVFCLCLSPAECFSRPCTRMYASSRGSVAHLV